MLMRHAQSPTIQQTNQCIKDHCFNFIQQCDPDCRDKITKCYQPLVEYHKQVSKESIIACLKENPKSWGLVECMINNCSLNQIQITDEILNQHLIKYAKLLA